MNRKLLIIKCNPIYFLPNRPKKTQRGCLHTFLRFLPILNPRQPRRVSLTERGRTQLTLKIANNNSHKTLALVQWIRIWSIDSSSTQQRKHLLAKFHPLFLSWSKTNTLPQEASQAKKPTLVGTQGLQIMLLGNWTTTLAILVLLTKLFPQNITNFKHPCPLLPIAL